MVKGPEAVSNPDLDTNSDQSCNISRLKSNKQESGYASPEPGVELLGAQFKKPTIETLSVLNKENLLKQEEQRPLKPDYYDFDGDEVPYSPPPEEAYLTRAGIEDKQMKPRTSNLLIAVMKYDPQRPREVLWEAFKRREQAAMEVVVHPVKDLEHYKLRDCISCEQREKQMKAEKAADPYDPALREYMVKDLNEGLLRLIGKVRCFHQEHMCVHAFMEMYIDSNFGNVEYINYDMKTTQEQLRKFSKLVNCYAETMKCLEMFCTKDQIEAFLKNSGLSSIYKISRNTISLALQKKIARAGGESKKAAKATESKKAAKATESKEAAKAAESKEAAKAAESKEAAKAAESKNAAEPKDASSF